LEPIFSIDFTASGGTLYCFKVPGVAGVVGMDEKAVRTSGVVGCLLFVLPVDWADVVGESVGGVVEYYCGLGDFVNLD
jgi:hypothetical protein